MSEAEFLNLVPRRRDAVVAEEVMEWIRPDPFSDIDDNFWYTGGNPKEEESYVWELDYAACFTASWEAMQSVVKKMHEKGWELVMEYDRYAQNWRALCYFEDENCEEYEAGAFLASLPLAVSVAALKAVGVIDGHEVRIHTGQPSPAGRKE